MPATAFPSSTDRPGRSAIGPARSVHDRPGPVGPRSARPGRSAISPALADRPSKPRQPRPGPGHPGPASDAGPARAVALAGTPVLVDRLVVTVHDRSGVHPQASIRAPLRSATPLAPAQGSPAPRWRAAAAASADRSAADCAAPRVTAAPTSAAVPSTRTTTTATRASTRTVPAPRSSWTPWVDHTHRSPANPAGLRPDAVSRSVTAPPSTTRPGPSRWPRPPTARRTSRR